MKTQYYSGLILIRLLIIGVEEEGECGPVRSGGRLNNIGYIVLIGLLVENLKFITGVLCMTLQVKIRPVGDSFQLGPTHGEEIFNIGTPLGVVGQFIRIVGS